MNGKQLLALAVLYLRLGFRPAVRVLLGVWVVLFLFGLGFSWITGEPFSGSAPWEAGLFVLLMPAFLTGVVRGGEEERAQALLCPMVMKRRQVVFLGVFARTVALLAVMALVMVLGALLSDSAGAPDQGMRRALLLLWVVELALLTACFSLLLPGEGNAVGSLMLMILGFWQFVERQGVGLPWFVLVLFPWAVEPEDLHRAAVSTAVTTLALGLLFALGVRERR